jgi:succinate dehydrogenase / fumarate reductase cytochrome b subunit
MKVAYWPGCVSRGFTPELHGSMAQVAPLLDIELVELTRSTRAPSPSPSRSTGPT